MRRLNNAHIRALRQRSHRVLSDTAPREHDQWCRSVGQCRDNRIRHHVPPETLMRSGTPRRHRQCAIQQEHTALSPGRQLSGRWCDGTQVGNELGTDVSQRTREGSCIGRHRKSQSHRQTVFGIRVLPQQKHHDSIEWRLQRAKKVRRIGQEGSARQGVREARELRFDGPKGIQPRTVDVPTADELVERPIEQPNVRHLERGAFFASACRRPCSARARATTTRSFIADTIVAVAAPTMATPPSISMTAKIRPGTVTGTMSP